MKRYDHLYEKIYDLENLRKAHQHAKKGKGWYREVQEIDKEPDKYLKQIQKMLINHTYKTSDYEVFYKQDGKKLRKIYKLPYFPDRICQWAILQVIEPCIINNLTADTYSAIPNRGIHKGLTKLQTAMWNDPEECKYCLGYRTFYKYTLLRKSTCLEMEKKMTAIRNKVEAWNMMNYSEWCSINSYKGWLKYADTFRLYQKYVVPLSPYADDYYIRNIKPNTKKGLNAA